MFSGSYLAEDVRFLLTPLRVPPISLLEKERLIQSGARHYSEMLTREKPPLPEYLELFDQAMARNRGRLATDLIRLATAISSQQSGDITLVSLARAGTPIGALLKRTLQRLQRTSVHYSISIVRDKGIDETALRYILQHHAAESLVFVDGWTGKGAIARQLWQSITAYNETHRVKLPVELCAVSDLAGLAAIAASGEDYLIPCAMLNSVVSGLISRSVIQHDSIEQGNFHGCVYYEEFVPWDRSRAFLESMTQEIESQLEDRPPRLSDSMAKELTRDERRHLAESFIRDTQSHYRVTDRNRVKPGVGEATRALMRRVPDRLLLADENSSEVAHLIWLAERQQVPIDITPWLPYQAAVIIRSLGQD